MSGAMGSVSWKSLLLGLALLSLVSATALHNYLLFHTISELFSVVIASSVFLLVWNSRQYHKNGYLIFVGISFLYVSLFDALHAIAYRGMGVFQQEGGTDLPTQVWMIARYMESAALLLAPLFFIRRVPLAATFLTYSVASLLGLLSLFYWKNFPDCFLPGVGLTPFKVYSEYVIMLLLVFAIAVLFKYRDQFDGTVFRLLVLSIATTIITEFCFTLYLTPYSISNMVGHLFKILSFWFMYQAILVTGLTRPHDLLFRGLQQEIEERKRIEKELLLTKDKALEATRAKSEFLANMSHEIRTPMNGVHGILQLLATTDLNEEQKEYVDIGVSALNNLLRLINDILDFSKIEARKVDIAEETFVLTQLCGAIPVLFREQINRKKIDYRFEIEPDVPEQVVSDPGRLRQILFNLVGNAVKFTEAGRVMLSVKKDRQDAGEGKVRLRFTVSDTGIGIPEDAISHLFEPFSQVDGSMTRKHQGTGLGLSIVKSLVELLSGTISMQSALGRGTTVDFDALVGLPEREDLTSAERIDNSPADGATGPLSGYAILVAEDDPISQKTLCRLLEKAGSQVRCADDGKQLLDLLEENRCDLVLMDVRMPIMDGVTATKIIRSGGQGYRDIPIIATTAHAIFGDREQFLAAGMTDFISKPIDADTLIVVIPRVMRKAKSTRWQSNE